MLAGVPHGWRKEAAVPRNCYSVKISRSEPRLRETEEKAALKVMCWNKARLGLKNRGKLGTFHSF